MAVANFSHCTSCSGNHRCIAAGEGSRYNFSWRTVDFRCLYIAVRGTVDPCFDSATDRHSLRTAVVFDVQTTRKKNSLSYYWYLISGCSTDTSLHKCCCTAHWSSIHSSCCCCYCSLATRHCSRNSVTMVQATTTDSSPTTIPNRSIKLEAQCIQAGARVQHKPQVKATI